ncbi:MULTISPECIES: hypothetical protein [Streptomyces]|uniref:Uncharacterized protein n=1 Tax=Streptomyces hyderabadensis TaxID=598549 RepID=A0ABP9HKV4_9ACTN|nr:hypothetical protein [Streptomyces hyderabadensis]
MNTNPALGLISEIFDSNAEHPSGSVDLTADLSGERTDVQAKTGAVKTLTISYWHCC